MHLVLLSEVLDFGKELRIHQSDTIFHPTNDVAPRDDLANLQPRSKNPAVDARCDGVSQQSVNQHDDAWREPTQTYQQDAEEAHAKPPYDVDIPTTGAQIRVVVRRVDVVLLIKKVDHIKLAIKTTHIQPPAVQVELPKRTCWLHKGFDHHEVVEHDFDCKRLQPKT